MRPLECSQTLTLSTPPPRILDPRRQSTERAVPVPIGSVLALALRLFRITPASPVRPRSALPFWPATLELTCRPLFAALSSQATPARRTQT